MLGIWTPLALSVGLLFFGASCYYLQRYKIHEGTILDKYRASPNSILIKLKLFRYDWRFNYLLLIPYLVTWFIFLGILIVYVLYWAGINEISNLLMSNWVGIILAFLNLIMMIYSGGIQELIFQVNLN